MAARPTFRLEFLTSMFASLGGGPLVLELTQMFAKKSLLASDWILALLAAEASAGYFFGAFFAPFLNGRRKIPFAVLARVILAAVMLAIAALPATAASAISYAALLGITPIMATLMLNVQSGVWHTNYPEAHRGRIYSRLVIVQIIFAAVSFKLTGYALDAWPWAHHLVYAAGAILVLLSAWTYSRTRVRREDEIIRREGKSRPHILAGFRVLAQDKVFGRYMLWQMVSGSAAMMSGPVVVLLFLKKFPMTFDMGTTVLLLVPAMVQLAAAPLSGVLFDHMNLMKFRTMNVLLWALTRLIQFFALYAGSLWGMVMGGAIQGFASSAGNVVWYIGHTKFAPPDRSQQYMGIHLTLTGMRGLVMPFLGVFLCNHVFFGTFQLGVWVIVISIAMQALAAFEFFFTPPLARDLGGLGAS